MEGSYLTLPTPFENPTTNVVALTFLPGLCYTLAAYGSTFFTGVSMIVSLLIAICFATIEYTFRVPLVSYASKTAKLSNGFQQGIWVVVTFILSILSDYFIPS